MPTDALLILQASTTKTAAFTGAALTLPAGTPRRGDVARVIYSATNTSSGAGSLTFGIDVSRDGGSTWNTEFEAPAIVLSTTAQSGEIFIPFSVSPSSVANGVQIRSAVEAISGTGATTTYFSDFMIARP